MKKYLWIFFVLVLICGGIIIFNNNNEQNNKYTAEKTSIKNEDLNQINIENDVSNTANIEEISSYSTKLPKDTKARYTNIDLACNTLNETIVKSGETFSLWDVLGCPTKEKGYKKAKTFTSEGKIKKAYGGGICQVSTTIYNAVLEADGLKVKERHEHSRAVSYIKDGKDAAVAYDTADFKFENTLNYDIKIEAKLEDNEVKIKLIRI